MDSSLVNTMPRNSKELNIRETFGKNTPYLGEYQEPHFGSSSQDMLATQYTQDLHSSPSGLTSPPPITAQSSAERPLHLATAEGHHQDNMQDFKTFLQRSSASKINLNDLS